jgi:hypothetical protein
MADAISPADTIASLLKAIPPPPGIDESMAVRTRLFDSAQNPDGDLGTARIERLKNLRTAAVEPLVGSSALGQQQTSCSHPLSSASRQQQTSKATSPLQALGASSQERGYVISIERGQPSSNVLRVLIRYGLA